MTSAASFSIGRDAFVHTGFYRPNLTLQVTPCRPNERIDLLSARLKDRLARPYDRLCHPAAHS